MIKLRGQLEAIAQAEEAARAQAAASLKHLQGEYASAKVRRRCRGTAARYCLVVQSYCCRTGRDGQGPAGTRWCLPCGGMWRRPARISRPVLPCPPLPPSAAFHPTLQTRLSKIQAAKAKRPRKAGPSKGEAEAAAAAAEAENGVGHAAAEAEGADAGASASDEEEGAAKASKRGRKKKAEVQA